jgi:hypothetical protein
MKVRFMNTLKRGVLNFRIRVVDNAVGNTGTITEFSDIIG